MSDEDPQTGRRGEAGPVVWDREGAGVNEKICVHCLHMVDVSDPGWEDRFCDENNSGPHAPGESPRTLADLKWLAERAEKLSRRDARGRYNEADAHETEDTVVWAAMRMIAAGAADPVAIAAVALKLRARSYARWFA